MACCACGMTPCPIPPSHLQRHALVKRASAWGSLSVCDVGVCVGHPSNGVGRLLAFGMRMPAVRVLRGTCGRQIRNQRHLVSIPQRIDTPVLLPTCSLPPHPIDLTAALNRLGAGRILCLLGTHEHANERRPPSNHTSSEGGLYPLFLDCHGRVWHVFKFGGGGQEIDTCASGSAALFLRGLGVVCLPANRKDRESRKICVP